MSQEALPDAHCIQGSTWHALCPRRATWHTHHLSAHVLRRRTHLCAGPIFCQPVAKLTLVRIARGWPCAFARRAVVRALRSGMEHGQARHRSRAAHAGCGRTGWQVWFAVTTSALRPLQYPSSHLPAPLILHWVHPSAHCVQGAHDAPGGASDCAHAAWAWRASRAARVLVPTHRCAGVTVSHTVALRASSNIALVRCRVAALAMGHTLRSGSGQHAW